MNFVEEVKWRGMIHDIMPGTEELLAKETISAYVGFDPTADSLHIGHLVGIMLLKHFQRAGHKPIALVGGATGMVGDPSGRSEERNLLYEDSLNHNIACIKKQLSKFLDFDSPAANSAILVNNYDWTKDYTFLGFIRDIGKYMTVNYMLAKDSVKNRMEKEGAGLSFTEFSYQLLQAFDYLFLYQNYGCKLQMGGSDQWGNITSGTDLIRKKTGGEAFAITCPLIKKADGQKFGKTAKGAVWLDAAKTSPYEFYQFWLNVSDADAENFVKIFTTLPKAETESLIEQHKAEPHQRILQKTLAKEVTTMVHSEEDYNAAVEASQILFGKGTTEQLRKLDEATFLAVFDGVKQFSVAKQDLEAGINVNELLAVKTQVFPSKSDLRRTITGGGLSINQEKVTNLEHTVSLTDIINEKYILVKKGKKDYSILKVE
jgi:tyrosyl-tRNA synthetase